MVMLMITLKLSSALVVVPALELVVLCLELVVLVGPATLLQNLPHSK